MKLYIKNNKNEGSKRMKGLIEFKYEIEKNYVNVHFDVEVSSDESEQEELPGFKL